MMDGKVCVVTGATSGVGLEAARALASMGATVALIGRNPDKGKSVQQSIGATARYPDRVSFMRTDLSSLGEVRALGRMLHERFDRIDVLLNNAGVINTRRQLTVDGYEETFAVNHLAHFLLTGLVLDLLRAAPQGRIINVSSNAHVTGVIKLDNLMRARGYTSFGAYSQSKLANLHFTFELARRLDGTAVTVNALHPGAVASGFATNNGWTGKLAMRLVRPFFLTPQQGAETAIYLAVAPELATVTGRYFYRKLQHATAGRAQDRDVARALWGASEALVGFVYPA